MSELTIGVIFLVALFFIGLIGAMFCDHEFWHGVFLLLLIVGIIGIIVILARYEILKEIKIWQLLNR